MHIILATEIWGKTSHVETMADKLRVVADKVSVVDPYDGSEPLFQSEDEAYEHYLKECGPDEYACRMNKALAKANQSAYLLGFSAGAGAVWSVVTSGVHNHLCGAACFYGSSIRTASDREPTVQTDLVFPNHEPHFDVEKLIQGMAEKKRVQCHRTRYGHGFMNPQSKNYSAEGYQTWLTWLQKEITNHRQKEQAYKK